MQQLVILRSDRLPHPDIVPITSDGSGADPLSYVPRPVSSVFLFELEREAP
jgi:hypothetical protein